MFDQAGTPNQGSPPRGTVVAGVESVQLEFVQCFVAPRLPISLWDDLTVP